LKLTRLLGVIAASNKPLTGGEIVNSMKEFYPGPRDRYIYEMINELAPLDDPIGDFLFCWTPQFSQNNADKIVNKFKKRIDEKYFKWNNEVRYRIEKSENENEKKQDIKKIILHEFGKNKSVIEITIESKPISNSGLNKQQKHDEININLTSNGRTWKFPSTTIRRHGKLFVYAERNSQKVRYLNIDTTPKAKKI
jgi:hypothetical protein